MSTSSLNLMRWRMGNQYSANRTGEMCSRLRVPVINRVAEFYRTCSLWSRASDMPYRAAFPKSRREMTRLWTIILDAEVVNERLILAIL